MRERQTQMLSRRRSAPVFQGKGWKEQRARSGFKACCLEPSKCLFPMAKRTPFRAPELKPFCS